VADEKRRYRTVVVSKAASPVSTPCRGRRRGLEEYNEGHRRARAPPQARTHDPPAAHRRNKLRSNPTERSACPRLAELGFYWGLSELHRGGILVAGRDLRGTPDRGIAGAVVFISAAPDPG